MKVAMDKGTNASLCLRLSPETRDEGKILIMLEGATVSTVQNGSGQYSAFILSLPVALHEPEPVALPAEG